MGEKQRSHDGCLPTRDGDPIPVTSPGGMSASASLINGRLTHRLNQK